MSLSTEKPKAVVFKFGGSRATDATGMSHDYFARFFAHLDQSCLDAQDRLAFVIGGGPKVRAMQATVEGNDQKDRIARDVLWENAESLRQVVQEQHLGPVAPVPHSPAEAMALLADPNYRSVAMSWLQEGQTTDASAAMIAAEWVERGYDAMVVILSNVAQIFTADPRVFQDAVPIAAASLDTLVEDGVLLGDPADFSPGMNVTIDPVAVYRLLQLGQAAPRLFFGHGDDLAAVNEFLGSGQASTGTVISPEVGEVRYGVR